MYAFPMAGEVGNAFESVVVDFLSGLIGAPLFMFCIGMGVVLSRRTDAKSHLIRGIGLLTFGLLLNIVRYGLEGLVGPILLEDPTYLSLLILVISVDIMQFAGMAFLLLALLEKLKMGSIGTLAIGIVLSLAGTLLVGVETGIYPLDQLIGFLWGTTTESYFPLFNWFIFVAMGKLYGEYYVRIRDYARWYRVVLPVAAALTALYLVLSLGGFLPSFSRLFSGDETGLCFITLFDACGCIFSSITFIGLLWLILGRFDIRPFTFISRNINKYYCLSYVYIIVLSGITRLEVLPQDSVLVALGFSAIVFALVTGSILLAKRKPLSTIGAFLMGHKLAFFATVWVVGIALTVIGYVECYQIDAFPNMFNWYLDL